MWDIHVAPPTRYQTAMEPRARIHPGSVLERSCEFFVIYIYMHIYIHTCSTPWTQSIQICVFFFRFSSSCMTSSLVSFINCILYSSLSPPPKLTLNGCYTVTSLASTVFHFFSRFVHVLYVARTGDNLHSFKIDVILFYFQLAKARLCQCNKQGQGMDFFPLLSSC